jgi:uncharacterized protein (DUF58 family)
MFSVMADRDLEYSCRFDVEDACEGDQIHFVETVRNGKWLPVLWAMFDIHTSLYLSYGESYSVVSQEGRRVSSVFAMRPQQKTVRTWNLTCLKRGVYQVNHVTLVWGGLLSGGVRSRSIECSANLVVYPGFVDLDSQFSPLSLDSGDYSVNRFVIEDPFVFVGVREYTPMDPMNLVHWSSTARHSQLMVRHNDHTAKVSMLVLCNIQAMEFEALDSTKPERSEEAIRVAATLLNVGLQTDAPCAFASNASLLSGTETVLTQFGTGSAQRDSLMDVLAHLECKNRRDFAEFLEETARSQVNVQLLVVTNYLSPRLGRVCQKIIGDGCKISVWLLEAAPIPEEFPSQIPLLIQQVKEAVAQ